MFYYFGRKKRLAGRYPEPAHDVIVEPFAGSAAYSLHGDRWQRDVRINDLDPEVVGLWKYLQSATRQDILALPDVMPGDRISAFKFLSDEERLLISLHAGPGKNRRNDVVSKFSRWSSGKRYVAENLHKIKHWQIGCGSYETLPNVEATWFVDPPYQRSGRLYRYNDIDFVGLAEWCQNRSGLVIVCEQEGASWLPFEPLVSLAITGRHVSHEMVWCNTFSEKSGIIDNDNDVEALS